MRIACLLVSMPLVLAGCRGLGPRSPDPQELFDEPTGTTFSMPSRPMVFTRDRTDVAAFARDYATLVAVESDRSGDYADYLVLYRWSTVDPRMSRQPDQRQGELKIVADGRVLRLVPLESAPIVSLPRRRLRLPENADVVVHAYRVDGEVLRYLAASREPYLELPQEAVSTPFRLWQDGRPALAEFARRTAIP